MIDFLLTVLLAQSPGVTIFPRIAEVHLPLILGRKLGALQGSAGKCAIENRIFEAIEIMLREGAP